MEVAARSAGWRWRSVAVSPEPVGPFLVQFWPLYGVSSGSRTGDTWAALPPGPRVAGCRLEGTEPWAPGRSGVGVTAATAGRGRWGLGPLRGAVATPRSAGGLSAACLWGPGSDPGIPAEAQRLPHAQQPSPPHAPAPAPSRGSRRSLLGPAVPLEAAPWAARERTPVPQAALHLRTRGTDTPRSCPAAFSSCHQPAGLASTVFETPTQG